MPGHAPPVADERSALSAYLRQQQDALRAAAFGLTDVQAGVAAAPPSALSVGRLLKHLTQTQESWLRRVLAAPGEPVDDRTMEEQYAEHAEGWTWHPHDTVEQALAAYDDVSLRVLDAIALADLDAAVPVPPAPWHPDDVAAWSVRWVWFHLVEELARHAGHADIVREAIDGATALELAAAREGWPETDWLKPWRPAAPPTSGTPDRP